MKKIDTRMIVCIIISLIAIGLLYMIYNKKEPYCGKCGGKTRGKLAGQQKEQFCCGACAGVGTKTYPDRALIRKEYEDGVLTEFTDRSGEREWRNQY